MEGKAGRGWGERQHRGQQGLAVELREGRVSAGSHWGAWAAVHDLEGLTAPALEELLWKVQCPSTQLLSGQGTPDPSRYILCSGC